MVKYYNLSQKNNNMDKSDMLDFSIFLKILPYIISITFLIFSFYKKENTDEKIFKRRDFLTSSTEIFNQKIDSYIWKNKININNNKSLKLLFKTNNDLKNYYFDYFSGNINLNIYPIRFDVMEKIKPNSKNDFLYIIRKNSLITLVLRSYNKKYNFSQILIKDSNNKFLADSVNSIWVSGLGASEFEYD